MGRNIKGKVEEKAYALKFCAKYQEKQRRDFHHGTAILLFFFPFISMLLNRGWDKIVCFFFLCNEYLHPLLIMDTGNLTTMVTA